MPSLSNTKVLYIGEFTMSLVRTSCQIFVHYLNGTQFFPHYGFLSGPVCILEHTLDSRNEARFLGLYCVRCSRYNRILIHGLRFHRCLLSFRQATGYQQNEKEKMQDFHMFGFLPLVVDGLVVQAGISRQPQRSLCKAQNIFGTGWYFR